MLIRLHMLQANVLLSLDSLSDISRACLVSSAWRLAVSSQRSWPNICTVKLSSCGSTANAALNWAAAHCSAAVELHAPACGCLEAADLQRNPQLQLQVHV